MKATSKIITLILILVFFVGLSVLLYPAISQYVNSKVQSRAVIDYEKMLAALSEEDYTEIFQQAYDYNERLGELPFPMSQYRNIEGYNEAINVFGNGMMGYIAIDKLQVELPVYHGTSEAVLNVACGHIEGTSLPVGGESTHSVLSAHRGLPHAKLFTNLDKMQVGDVFTITILNQVLTYQVDQVKVITPANTNDLQIVEGEDYCTLLTCTPYGINTHRLLVRGRRIETIEHKSYYVNSEAYLIDRLIVTPIVALPIIFAMTVYVVFKPVKKKPRIEEDQES